MDLKGKVVKSVSYVPKDELEKVGWSRDKDKVTRVEFNDGSYIYASCDEEANGPGCMFGVTTDGEGCYIFAQ